jgi:hypothetical protein
VEERPSTALDDTDPAAYLHLFRQITKMLETTGVSLDSIVERECRDLLGSAGSLIYSNILRIHPAFELDEVLEDLDAPLDTKLSAKVQEHVEALQEAYRQVDKPASGEASGYHSGDDSGEAREAAGENSLA